MTEEEFTNAFKVHEKPKSIIEKGLRKLRLWLRDEKITTEQGFEQILDWGQSTNRINIDQFVDVMKRFEFTAYEAEVLFVEIDTK